jgi:geranylgeranyl pyrophosphate synthase
MTNVPATRRALPAKVPETLVELLEANFEEAALDPQLALPGARLPKRLWENALLAPLRDFLARPAEGARAKLAIAFWELGGGRGEAPRALSQLVELLHAGSLIIDDVEDGTLRRRGGPALQEEWGAPVALSAGNWLYFWSYQLVRRVTWPRADAASIERLVTEALTRCHYGQALDRSVRIGALPQAQVHGVVDATAGLKSGSLLELAAALGALAGGAGAARTHAIARFGRATGVELQMSDDLSALLDSGLSQKSRNDLRTGRPTWPWAWLAREAEPDRFEKLQAMQRAAQQGALPAEDVAEALRRSLGGRGLRHIRDHRRASLSALRAEVGDPPVVGRMERELTRREERFG